MLPMMLIFTVKNQQKIRVDVQPPRQLQFHDNEGMKFEDFLKMCAAAENRRANPYQPPKELQYYDSSSFEMKEQQKTSPKEEVNNHPMMAAVYVNEINDVCITFFEVDA